MKPYRLLLISHNKPKTANDIRSSNHMIGWGLWDSFSRLPHVSLCYQNAEVPLQQPYPVDFTLMHCYTSARIFKEMDAVRAITAKHVMSISEAMRYDNEVHRNFSFLPHPNWEKYVNIHGQRFATVEEIKFPHISSLLENRPKLKGSILLDHAWEENSPERLWCGKLYKWLEPLKDSIQIAQLLRLAIKADPYPAWVRPIPELGYLDYLDQTAAYENYIMTHPESYGHSIIDMVARGIRVLVPIQGSLSFAKKPIVDGLKLQTFSNREELMALLSAPVEDNWRAKLCTDMPDIVRRLDAYCQEQMEML